MKKIFLIFPLVILMTAACNPSQQIYNQSAPIPTLAPTPTPPTIQPFPYLGRSVTITPDAIVSIDEKSQSFQFSPGQHGGGGYTITIVPETEIKSLIANDNKTLKFSNLAVGDQVFVRGIPQKDDSNILAKQVLIISAWRSTTLIIDGIDSGNNTLHGSAFIGDSSSQTIKLISETEIRKGKPELGQQRPIVTINNLKIGDISGYILELAIGSNSNQANFIAIDIDVVSPYPCQQYIKPAGCVNYQYPKK